MNKKFFSKVILLNLCLFIALSIPLSFTPVGRCEGEDILGWGVDYIDAERVWGGFEDATDVIPGNPAGQGVKVLVIDTGIDMNHYDLDDRYKGGYDNYGEDSYPEDINGHGTMCSGVIAAEDNEKGIIGVAPEADLYMYRIDGDGLNLNPWQIQYAVSWAISHNIDVISMSFTFKNEDAWIFHQVIHSAYTNGIVLVAATGNNNKNKVLSPACHPDVIAVGGVQQSGEKVIRWVDFGSDSGSNYGDGEYWAFLPFPWLFGSHIDLVAPADNIPTTDLSNTIEADFDGTSCATPHVAGVCALIISQDLQDGKRDLSPSQIKSILCKTADKDIFRDLEGFRYNYNEHGHGFVNAYGACDLENPTVSITSPSYIVSGTVTCRASASDNYRVDKVKFWLGENPFFWHEDTDGSDGWSWVWNTNGVSDGPYTLFCRAYDARGNYKQTTRSVYVNNGGGGGGGGCPILSVFNGETYIDEGLLDIHNPEGIDVVYAHTLLSDPFPIDNRYHLRLTEHHYTISHIDKVELWGELPNGEMKKLYLISAIHSELGQVWSKLWLSDDKRIDLYGADHNDGISEFIDLEFYVSSSMQFNKIVFVIEGNNVIIKP
ncbi:MAG: S8 family serine peptidase [Promethearchaeota archaeon]